MTFKLTEKVDVYSFGVVLFEAICGQLPLVRGTETGDTNIHISQWVTTTSKTTHIGASEGN